MEDEQRTKIVEASADVMHERGSATTLAAVAKRAGVPAGTLQREFPDEEALVLAAFELGLERARAKVLPAFDAERRWLDAIRAGLAAMLRFADEEPAFASVLLVHWTSGGKLVTQRRVQVLGELAGVVDQGRLEMPTGRPQQPPIIAEGVVGAVLQVMHNRLIAEGRGPVVELYGSLVSIVVLPYLGSAVARRELTRPMPRVRATLARGHGPSAEMRLTYRSARVLATIADYPGASNREIADRAGVVDQGQISKLLSRLEGHGLIARMSQGRTRGSPNSWCLTEQGERVLDDAPSD